MLLENKILEKVFSKKMSDVERTVVFNSIGEILKDKAANCDGDPEDIVIDKKQLADFYLKLYELFKESDNNYG